MNFPIWASRLTSMYVYLRIGRRNKALRRQYYREIQAEKLRLAEEGVNQEKIRQACRFLSSVACVRNYQCDHCRRIREFVMSEDSQLVLSFCF